VTSVSKTAAIGDAIADALNDGATKTAFSIGVDYTAVFGYALTADTKDTATGIIVRVSPVSIDVTRPGLGAVVGVRTLAIAVQLKVNDGIHDRTLLDPAMALVDKICEWLIVGDTAGQPRFFDTDTYAVDPVKVILGDHLNEALNDLNKFHVPIIADFRRTS
jgi:hypothetical protein